MGLINELGGQPYSCIHTSFTAIVNFKMDGGSTSTSGIRLIERTARSARIFVAGSLLYMNTVYLEINIGNWKSNIWFRLLDYLKGESQSTWPNPVVLWVHGIHWS